MNDTINLNDRIRFKLTDKGRAYIAKLNAEDPIYRTVPLHYREDADGWITEQLWCVMSVFGSTFGMTCHPTIETTLHLCGSTNPAPPGRER